MNCRDHIYQTGCARCVSRAAEQRSRSRLLAARWVIVAASATCLALYALGAPDWVFAVSGIGSGLSLMLGLHPSQRS